MLDLMRKANTLKWFVRVVIISVVLAFVISIFMIWGGAGTRNTASGASATWVARVNGQDITPFELERQRLNVENQYRQVLGDQFEQQAAAFDFDQLALRQLLGQALAYSEANRLGLSTAPSEVADTIVHMSAFQRNGAFIGREQYIQELRGRSFDVGEFEAQIARELTVDKLRDLVGTMVSVTDADVEKAFNEEGQSAEVDYVLFKQSDYPVTGEPSAKEIEAWYRDHRAAYLTPEKRRAAYLLIDRDPLQKSVQVSDTEIRDSYEKDKETTYRNPEQRRASHILLKAPAEAKPEEADAVRKKAEALLARARGGEDFAKLARENSEDPGSASEGGDLQWFGKGRMVPEFEQAVFSLSDGQISDIVRTPFGFHIIKMTGSRPAGVTPFEEVREQIRQTLAFKKAQELLSKKSDEVATRLSQQSSSFEATATELGLTVKDTGWFGKGDPIGDLGPMPQAAEEIFRLKSGDHSGPIPTPRGILFARLVDVQQPQAAPFDGVKDRVKADLVKDRSLEKARAAARELAAAGADGFKAAADRKKLEVKSTGEFTRAAAPADLG
ncbi:MAG TPA: peptidylprolyl isomerase, partial [Patescibacteria group bacterium]|nr:peptidylprolyl isomerase [Patescibacteria group bacterium]